MIYTTAAGDCQQNIRSRRLKDTRGVNQDEHFWRKAASFSVSIDSVDNNVSGDVRTMQNKCTNVALKLSGFL